jgi:hypothetical protein
MDNGEVTYWWINVIGNKHLVERAGFPYNASLVGIWNERNLRVLKNTATLTAILK